MSRTFYVDSRTGSDANAGSAKAPWASLDKVNSAGLQPGDTVLFARGATFDGTLVVDESGARGAPITFGAFGSGANPVFANGQNGVAGNGHDHIVIRDIQIENMDGAGIISFGSADWVITNVDVDGAGLGHVPGDNEFAAFQFRDSSGLTIQNSTYKNVVGDGVFLWDVDGAKILDNDFGTPTGESSDNLHSYLLRNFEISGNKMSFAGETDSGKGNMVLQESENGIVADNTFILGGHAHYGIGGTVENGVIEGNHFVGRIEDDWSVGLNVTETLGSPSTVNNMTIRGNFFDGVGTGIYTWDGNDAGTAYRNDFNITGNIFKNLRDPALVSEGAVELNGSYAKNTLINSADPVLDGTAGHWTDSGNVHTASTGVVKAFLAAMGTPGATVRPAEVFAEPAPVKTAAAAAPEPVSAAPAARIALLEDFARIQAEAGAL